MIFTIFSKFSMLMRCEEKRRLPAPFVRYASRHPATFFKLFYGKSRMSRKSWQRNLREDPKTESRAVLSMKAGTWPNSWFDIFKLAFIKPSFVRKKGGDQKVKIKPLWRFFCFLCFVNFSTIQWSSCLDSKPSTRPLSVLFQTQLL